MNYPGETMRQTVTDDIARWAALGLEAPKAKYDIRHIGINPSQLRDSVAAGYADPDERQNDSPSIAEFLAFVDANGGNHAPYSFEAYIVSPQREDCRISVEGIVCLSTLPKDQVTFLEWAGARNPDELDRRRAWWD